MSWLGKEFMASPEWKEYSPGTKAGKIGRFNEIVEARLLGETLKFGELDYTLIRRKHIYPLRAIKFEEGSHVNRNRLSNRKCICMGHQASIIII